MKARTSCNIHKAILNYFEFKSFSSTCSPEWPTSHHQGETPVRISSARLCLDHIHNVDTVMYTLVSCYTCSVLATCTLQYNQYNTSLCYTTDYMIPKLYDDFFMNLSCSTHICYAIAAASSVNLATSDAAAASSMAAFAASESAVSASCTASSAAASASSAAAVACCRKTQPIRVCRYRF